MVSVFGFVPLCVVTPVCALVPLRGVWRLGGVVLLFAVVSFWPACCYTMFPFVVDSCVCVVLLHLNFMLIGCVSMVFFREVVRHCIGVRPPFRLRTRFLKA